MTSSASSEPTPVATPNPDTNRSPESSTHRHSYTHWSGPLTSSTEADRSDLWRTWGGVGRYDSGPPGSELYPLKDGPTSERNHVPGLRTHDIATPTRRGTLPPLQPRSSSFGDRSSVTTVTPVPFYRFRALWVPAADPTEVGKKRRAPWVDRGVDGSGPPSLSRLFP